MLGRKKKSNYHAVMVVRVANGYKEYTTVDIDISKETFTCESKSYKIDLEKDVWTNKKGETFLFYIVGSGAQLSFKEFKSVIPPEIMDDILVKGILGQIVARMRNALGLSDKYSWVTIVVILLVGGVIGYFIGQNYAPAKEVIRYLNQTGVPTA
jgi:hypothetical protein